MMMSQRFIYAAACFRAPSTRAGLGPCYLMAPPLQPPPLIPRRYKIPHKATSLFAIIAPQRGKHLGKDF
jgi:hypothetical protein